MPITEILIFFLITMCITGIIILVSILRKTKRKADQAEKEYKDRTSDVPFTTLEEYEDFWTR